MKPAINLGCVSDLLYQSVQECVCKLVMCSISCLNRVLAALSYELLRDLLPLYIVHTFSLNILPYFKRVLLNSYDSNLLTTYKYVNIDYIISCSEMLPLNKFKNPI